MDRIFKKLNRYFHGKWHLAVLDLKAGRWIKSPRLSNIAYLKAQNAQGRHILIQPVPSMDRFYFLADDLNWDRIRKNHRHVDKSFKPGRMVIETSPGNYQVWIHSSHALPLQEKRYWLKKMGSDPGADPKNRWGRCPGFRNRKDKYRDNRGYYPLARLIWVDWKRQAQVPVCYPHKVQRHHGVAICRSDYFTGNESSTDFAYALALIRRGYTDTQVESRLRNERVLWKNHHGQRRMQSYLNRTIDKARSIIESN